jgi:SHS2 domain-containing protein
MGRAETFEHTADLGLRIRASDLTDLFRTAGEGLFDVIVVNRADVRPLEIEPIALEAESTEDLLVAWLNELIFRCETRHRLYSLFEVVVDAGGFLLQGIIGGEPIDRSRHTLDHEVKAATHHGLSLRREDGGWISELILDI